VGKFLRTIANGDTKADPTLTQPGSLAATYLQEQTQQAAAVAADGNPYPAQAVQQIAGGWRIGDPVSGEGNTFDGFRFTPAGKITTLSVNGQPLAGRLARGNDMSGGGLTLSHVISCKTISGEVYVTFDAHNTRSHQSVRVEFHDCNVPPTLVSLTGQQFSQKDVDSSGPTELQPGASSSYAIAFQAPDVGRQFRIELLPNVSLNEVYVGTQLHRVK
jgi:hypothetical protein